MATTPVKFTQIAVNADHIYGLDENGAVWYRHKPPFSTTIHTDAQRTQKKKDDEEDVKKLWVKLRMSGKVDLPPPPEAKDIPSEIELTERSIPSAPDDVVIETKPVVDDSYYPANDPSIIEFGDEQVSACAELCGDD